MTTYHSATISTHESIVRILGGAILILSVLAKSTPPWIALIAVYPVISGIIMWDPLYGLFLVIKRRISLLFHHKTRTNHISPMNI